MEVDDTMGQSCDEELGNEQQATGEPDEVDIMVLENGHEVAWSVELCLGYNICFDSKFLRSYQGVCISLVAQNEPDGDVCTVFKIANDILAVGSIA